MDKNIYENQIYLSSFVNSKYPEWTNCFKQYRAWKQYESTLSRFMDSIQKDIVTITEEDIENFLKNDKNPKTKDNKEKHIKALLSFILKENISLCRLRASKYVLAFTGTLSGWLINDTELLSRLLNKKE